MSRLFLLSVFLLAQISHSATEAEIRALMGDTNKKRISAIIKQGDHAAIIGKNITYELPNGNMVSGVLLPDGRVSPAVRHRGELVPACLTTQGRLVAGEYNQQRGKVVCAIPKSQLVVIEGMQDTLNKGLIDKYKPDDTPKPQDAAPTAPAPDKQDGTGTNATRTPTPDKQKKKIDKYTRHGAKKPQSGSTGKGKPPRKSQPKQANQQANQFIYRPPTDRGAKASAVVGVLSSNEGFGIRVGTWGEVELQRSVSSADSGSVEFVLLSTLIGERKALEAGTILFAKPQINMQTRRFDAQIYSALTPSGEEIDVKAWVYDLNKRAGLSGILVRDRAGESEAAGFRAALKGVSAAAKPALGGVDSVGGVMAESYSSDMIDNEKKYAPRNPRATIKVSAQRAYLKIAKTF